MRISSFAMYVTNPEKLANFYCSKLGMHRLVTSDSLAIGYGGDCVKLIFKSTAGGGNYQLEPNSRYWKIAITVPNLDFAYQQLKEAGCEISTPHQFRQIAYMSHLTDPEGHLVELIQHTFQESKSDAVANPKKPLGGCARLGLITLRTANIKKEMDICLNKLGMKYLSRQEVSDKGFDLYFFAFTQETPPDADLNSVRNREWLWQRPYTVLEFQHKFNENQISAARAGSLGATEIAFELEEGNTCFFI